MGIVDNLFVFVNAINKNDEDETIKLNIKDKELHFFHNDKEIIIDTELLDPNTSTCIVYNQITGNDYVLYNFMELCQALDVPSREFATVFQQRCFMQIDTNSHGELFIKAFLLKGMNELPSDTNDFSGKMHCTTDNIHPLDINFSWGVYNLYGIKDDGKFKIKFNFKQSDFIKDMKVYCNYASQHKECVLGENEMEFKYIPGEDIYFGKIRSRRKGRCFIVNNILENPNYYKDIIK